MDSSSPGKLETFDGILLALSQGKDKRGDRLDLDTNKLK